MAIGIADLAKVKARHEREKLVLSLLKQLDYLGLGNQFIREYRFDAVRRWRFDLYHPSARLAVELHGGTWTRGRHVTGIGFQKDREKCNAALEAGIRVLEFTADHVRSGHALSQIERVLKKSREL